VDGGRSAEPAPRDPLPAPTVRLPPAPPRRDPLPPAPAARPGAHGGGSALDSARRIIAARASARQGSAGSPPRGTPGRERAPGLRPDGGGPSGGGAAAALRRSPLGGRLGLVALIAAVIALALLWFALSLFQPFKGEGEGEVQIKVPAGASVGQIGDLLEQRGVVSSGFFFATRARLGGDTADLKSGNFTLREDMSYAAALDALSTAPPPPKLLNATIPEGLARSEVVPILEDAGLKGDYIEATESSKLLDPADFGAKDATDLEGFLFPATYELKTGASVDDLVAQQVDAFEREFEGVDLKQAKRANLSPYDVLTIASMIEREAQLDEERPLISSVIYNRLSDGMPLGIDATIRFATENWTEPLKESELAIDSPYNTRLNTGLPPGPIGSPGIESIQAAANPDETDFLYYVVKPGTCGEHSFAETDAQFQQDVERYNSERAARGGQSPTDC